MQDHKLRAGSVARTKERIQCICEGAFTLTVSCKHLTVTKLRFAIHQEGISVRAKTLVVKRHRALSQACMPVGLRNRYLRTVRSVYMAHVPTAN